MLKKAKLCNYSEKGVLVKVIIRSQSTNYWKLNEGQGSMGVGLAVPGSLGYRGVTLVARGGGSSYSPGAVDADYNLSPHKTVCAW